MPRVRIWTHDPRVRGNEESSYVRQRGHCDRLSLQHTNFKIHMQLFTVRLWYSGCHEVKTVYWMRRQSALRHLCSQNYTKIKYASVIWCIPDYCDFWLCLSTGILKNTTFRKQNLFPSSGEEFQWVRLGLGRGPNRFQCLPPPHPRTEAYCFRNAVFFRVL
jgi:hypothetical protein